MYDRHIRNKKTVVAFEIKQQTIKLFVFIFDYEQSEGATSDNYTSLSLPLTLLQVKEMIIKAEEGRFIYIHDLKDRITSWKGKFKSI